MRSLMLRKTSIVALVVSVGAALSSATVRGGDIYVVNSSTGTIGEYTTSGAVVNTSLIPGLNWPDGIAVSGSNLFVANTDSNTVCEYTTSGAVVNTSLISGVNWPTGIAVSGSNLFVSTGNYGRIGEYTTSGAVVNASLITGLNSPYAIAVSGPNLFVANTRNGTIGEYTTSGAVVNASLITGLSSPWGITVSGSNLFVVNQVGTIGEYTTSGAVVNASLITGLGQPNGIVVSGSNLFVANVNTGTIGEYTTSGAVVNTSLITGLGQPLGIALVSKPPTIALAAASNATIITGGTSSLGTSVSNSGAFDTDNLNYTMITAIQSGGGTLGTVAHATGSLAPSASQSCTVPATSTNLGVNTISLTASDPNASNSPQTTTGTLTVLDHAAAAFAGGGTTLNLNFGNVEFGSGTLALPFQVENLFAAYRAGLARNSVTAISDPLGLFSTDAADFADMAPGALSDVYDVDLSTSQLGQFSGQYQFNLSDEQDLSGHAGQQTLTLNVTADVVPEPSTLTLLAAGAIGLVGYGLRRRRAAGRTAKPAAFDQPQDEPPILAFPSRSFPASAARRAA